MGHLWGWDPSFKVFAGSPKLHGSNLGSNDQFLPFYFFCLFVFSTFPFALFPKI